MGNFRQAGSSLSDAAGIAEASDFTGKAELSNQHFCFCLQSKCSTNDTLPGPPRAGPSF